MDRFNRERFAVLNQETRDGLRNMAQLRAQHPDGFVIGNNDFVEQMHYLFKTQWENLSKERIFLFTKRVTHRVEQMNVKSLLGPIELLEPILRKDEQGYIIIPKESWNGLDDLNVYYSIQEGNLYMHVCVGEVKVGYVIADKTFSQFTELVPWSLISMIRFNKFPRKDQMKPMEKMFTDLVHDFTELSTGNYDEFIKKIGDVKVLKQVKKKQLKSEPVFEMHAYAFSMVHMAFKAFIFLKTSDVYSQEYIPDPTPSAYRRKKGFRPLNYIQVDATWDMNIDVNTPFPVRGHFTHQPCKDEDGKWIRKLIYIEQYMKKGYHRKAKKTIEGV